MPSSWDVYYVIFLSAVLALGVPATLAVVSHLVSPRKMKKRLNARVLDELTETDESCLGKKINARFFLGVNAALILLALAILLIPCAGVLRKSEGPLSILRALVAIVGTTSFAALGLLYSAKKGDLSWLGTFQGGKPDGNPGGKR